MERKQIDVALLRSGGAGMAAAITAAEGGAKVIVLEKRPFPGGTSNTPVGFRSVRMEKAFRDKAFQVHQVHMDQTRWAANAELVRAWINRSGEIPEWLTQLGVELIPPTERLALKDMGTAWKFGGFPKG